MKSKIAFAMAAIALMTGTSFAADVAVTDLHVSRPIPVVRRADWTGLYFGINAGFSWAQATTNTVIEPAATGFIPVVPPAAITATSSAQLSGGVAGGQIGFNWQTGWLVIGIEADGQWSGQESSVTAVCVTVCTSLTGNVKLRSFWSGRFRAGYAFDRILAYGTFGGVVANALHDWTATISGATASFLPLSNSRAGLAAGVGVEGMFWGNWSARLEYLYLDIDNLVATGFAPNAFGTPYGNGAVTVTSRFRDHILRAGINYRFGPE